MGGVAAIVRVWVVKALLVETLFEGFQGLLLGRSEITEVACKQFRIIGPVSIWMLEFGHVLRTGYPITTDAMATFRSPVIDHFTLLIPDCRQEPLDNSLSLPEVQQRYSLIRKMCLVLPQKYFEQSAHRGAISRSQNFGQEGDAGHDSRTLFRGTEPTGWTTPQN